MARLINHGLADFSPGGRGGDIDSGSSSNINKYIAAFIESASDSSSADDDVVLIGTCTSPICISSASSDGVECVTTCTQSVTYSNAARAANTWRQGVKHAAETGGGGDTDAAAPDSAGASCTLTDGGI